MEYSSGRSTSEPTPDYLPYSYQRTAPYLLWDDTSSHLASSRQSSSCNSCSCCRATTICFIALLIAGFFTLVGVAVYFGVITNKFGDDSTDTEIMEGSLRVVSGDRYSAGLRDRRSPEFTIKAQTYEQLINTVYQKSGLQSAFYYSQVVGFQNGSLVVSFRLYLDRRRLPPEPLKAVYDVFSNEVATSNPVAFKTLKIDPTTLNISSMTSTKKEKVIDFLAVQQQTVPTTTELPKTTTTFTTTTSSTSLPQTTQKVPENTQTPPVSIGGTDNDQNTAPVDYGSWKPFVPQHDTPYEQKPVPADSNNPNENSAPTSSSQSLPITNTPSSFSFKPVRGTASEINFDWEPEEGVRTLFQSPPRSNANSNRFANRAGVPLRTDGSQEFGTRMQSPNQGDELLFRMDSPALVITKHSSSRTSSTRTATSTLAPKSAETHKQASSSVLTIRRNSSRSTTVSGWIPVTYSTTQRSGELSSQELLSRRDDPQTGFGLRMPSDSTVLESQSSQGVLVRLPPGTRFSSKFADDRIHRLPQPEMLSQERPSDFNVDRPSEDDHLHLPEAPAPLEGRVISSDKSNTNVLRDPPLRIYPPFTEIRFTRQPKLLDFLMGNLNLSKSSTPNVTIITSVKKSSSMRNQFVSLNNNITKIDVATITDSPTPFTITSVQMSVREEANDTFGMFESDMENLTSISDNSKTTHNAPEMEEHMVTFPELMKLSAIKSTTQGITESTAEETADDNETTTDYTTSNPTDNTTSSPTNDIISSSIHDTVSDSVDDTTSDSTDNTTDSTTPDTTVNDVIYITDRVNQSLNVVIQNISAEDEGSNQLRTDSQNSITDDSSTIASGAVDDDSFDEADIESNSVLSTDSLEALNMKSSTPSVLTSSVTFETKEKCSKSTQFECNNGECVSIFSRCNRMKDCADNSDEEGCTCADFIRGNVINSTLCDGVVDCWDYSDENQCEWCDPSMYVCPNARACIPRKKLCDGILDCPGGEDERSCVAVAPNITAADDGAYWGAGYVMVRREGRWGKLCMQNFDNFVSQASNAVGDLGRVLCRTLGYSDFEEVKELKDPFPVPRDETSLYYEPTYANNTASRSRTRSRSLSVQFIPSSCQTKQVIKVMCKDFGCGKRHETLKSRARIVGGVNSTPGSWPWQAAVYKEGGFMCGATLISDQWMLSAAHCFYQAIDNYWTVRLGVLRRGSHSPYERVHRLSHVIIHPNYISSNFINDIVLLRLSEPVEFSAYIRPICLPSIEATQESIRRKRSCTVVGWGQVDEEGDYLPDTLQEVKLPLISAEECRKRTTLLTSYARVNDNMFCAGLERGGRDACLGDSGGPIMCQESDGRWSLTGITSNGFGCARAMRPGIYTKVANYASWITKVTEGSLPRPVRTSCNGHRCMLGKCVSHRQVCDGFVDCDDGSDEDDCDWSAKAQL